MRGQLCHGFSLGISRNIEVVHMAAAAGYDCVFIDLEHRSAGLDWANQNAVASLYAGWAENSSPSFTERADSHSLVHRITPIVRVPALTSDWISRALDGGAQTIFVPHVQNAAEAREIVRFAKYTPVGERSASAYMSIMRYHSARAVYANAVANENTMVAPMIETASALEQAEWVCHF